MLLGENKEILNLELFNSLLLSSLLGVQIPSQSSRDLLMQRE
jgi:hypothetical protein